jgi:hypothetical protein
MDKESSFEESVIVWNVFIELHITASDSDHDLVTSALDDLLLGSNQVDLSFNVNNWNGQVQLCDKSLNLFLEGVILSFFHYEWNRGGVEKIVTFDIKICFRKHIEINFSIGEMFIVEVLFLPKLEKSQFLGLVILKGSELSQESSLLIFMINLDSLSLV